MSEPAAQSGRSWRPRFSLLTVLLLITIAGMAIVIVQLWRAVGPLRREVETLRAEVGVLGIDDASKIHVVQVKSPGSFHWTWRIWLPKARWFARVNGATPAIISAFLCGQFGASLSPSMALSRRSSSAEPGLIWKGGRTSEVPISGRQAHAA